MPISPKKLVLVRDGRPAHRACRPVTGVPVKVAAAAAAAPKPAKPMSRGEMLRRIEQLRKRDAQKPGTASKRTAAKGTAAKGTAPAKAGRPVAAKKAAGKKAAGRPVPVPVPVKKAAGKKAAPERVSSAGRSRVRSGVSPAAQPQPYYGVEMKSVGGRWVQMHPDSE
ncbi:hypothetical protein R6L23_23795 [Streptomyces sp. SR27]|uniref:hypothetical protein n=1 Tax=Streptomyces sp. SR27 TaxID=3076630 RepID=UPI00295BDD3F|nr:hypothetical protein [Streptomyces sp. SR27]MDV9191188.1 hypothetical protein [Streptomyces sp. SR27]